MSKKNLSDLELDELLSELETASSERPFKTDGVKEDVLTFFNVFNFRTGEETIPLKVLFKLYKAWSKTPVKAQVFASRVKEVFTTTYTLVKFDEELFKIKREDWIYFYSNKEKMASTAHQKRNFDAFIKKFGIEQGEDPVNFEALAQLYTRFVNEYKCHSMSKKTLNEFFKLYFKEKITIHGIYYNVSDRIWDSLSREVYNEKEKKAKDSKKYKKISITNS